MSVRKTLWTVALAVVVGLVPGVAYAQTPDEPVKVRCGATDSFWGLLICAATCSEALDKDTVTLQECKRIDGEVR
ncbi:hypothetical protein [Nocardiopsis lucentensis]|uniref:hypothetical protein n=1 Tax=Nocardiopsis lucentensis TaxID=53441 RepID=UPI000346B21F|nr:hypothetical protein [Nocardiopsis lucentensis]